MVDKISQEARSRNMSAIRSTDTEPEIMLRKMLFSKGFRYRKNVNKLPGCPDIVLPKYNAVIFVNGCFWHMHDCKRFKWPKTNQAFWKEKILRNVERDTNNKKKLMERGWKVIVVWECEIKRNINEVEEKIEKLLQQETPTE